jgi:hypothetical protein
VDRHGEVVLLGRVLEAGGLAAGPGVLHDS